MRRLVAAVALVCFGGCASTATIARSDGPDSETHIDSSDAGGLNVRARNGRIYRIPRDSVIAIDHPGNVEILLGSILLGIVGYAVYSIRNDGSSSDQDVLLPVALLYGSPGVALLISGLVKYVPSVQAARAFESVDGPPPAWVPPPPPLRAPPPAPTVSPPATEPSTTPPPEEPAPEVVPDPT
jgi:hypothetical protein